jgi:uncharacterized protein YbaR (Trm112 family)
MEHEKAPVKDLVGMLVCPQCKNELVHNSRERALTCPVCSLRYPIRNGIPDMLPADAEDA